MEYRQASTVYVASITDILCNDCPLPDTLQAMGDGQVFHCSQCRFDKCTMCAVIEMTIAAVSPFFVLVYGQDWFTHLFF